MYGMHFLLAVTFGGVRSTASTVPGTSWYPAHRNIAIADVGAANDPLQVL